MADSFRGFDEESLREELDQLGASLGAIFAASCAQRLLCGLAELESGGGSPPLHKLEVMLEGVWHKLKADEIDESWALAMEAECMAIIESAEFGVAPANRPYAEDVSAAIAYTLRALRTDAGTNAGWAARCVYESLDQFVIRLLNSDLNSPSTESRILSNALVQRELGRQARDLEDLRSSGSKKIDRFSRVDEFKVRSVSEGRTFFRWCCED